MDIQCGVGAAPGAEVEDRLRCSVEVVTLLLRSARKLEASLMVPVLSTWPNTCEYSDLERETSSSAVSMGSLEKMCSASVMSVVKSSLELVTLPKTMSMDSTLGRSSVGAKITARLDSVILLLSLKLATSFRNSISCAITCLLPNGSRSIVCRIAKILYSGSRIPFAVINDSYLFFFFELKKENKLKENRKQ